MVEGMKITSWRQEDRQSKKTLEVGMWNGRVSVRAYESGNFKNSSFNRNLNDTEVILMEKAIGKVISGSPETKQSISFQKYDFNSKQFRIAAVITIEKDAKQMYRISLTDCQTQVTTSFVLKAPATASFGNEPLDDRNLSALKLESLKDWLTSSRVWAPFTYVPPKDGQGGGRRGGGGYGGGAPAAAPAASSNDSDDLPF